MNSNRIYREVQGANLKVRRFDNSLNLKTEQPEFTNSEAPTSKRTLEKLFEFKEQLVEFEKKSESHGHKLFNNV